MSFIWKKLLQSVLKKVVLVVVSFVTGPKVSAALTALGVTIDPVVLSVGLFGLLEGLRGWLSHQAWSSKLPKWVLTAI